MVLEREASESIQRKMLQKDNNTVAIDAFEEMSETKDATTKNNAFTQTQFQSNYSHVVLQSYLNHGLPFLKR